MNALLYKELKLAMHPICYLFVFLFPLMILIPSYPIAIGFIYVLTCYPILFLGANKGQQSNDLLFSTLLPVRKKDIVMARILTVFLMQSVFILVMSALMPLASLINSSITVQEGSKASQLTNAGIPLSGYISIVGIALIGFAFADLIYFSIYYKRGKSIVMSTLLTIIGFVIYLAVFTIIIPYIPGCEGYVQLLAHSGVGPQLIILGAAIVIYVAIHFVVYKVASKELELVDF